MSYLDSIVLGLIQGITEFIPVSSSGHLVIAGHLLGFSDLFTFDVLLNFGTLLALIVYFRRRIWAVISRLNDDKEWVLLGKITLATVPAATLGFIFNKQIKTMNTMVWIVIVMLVVVGIAMIMFGKEKANANTKEIEESISWMTSIRMGIMQVVAFIPGTSRSGITILTGLASGISSKRAAEFSFLLAIPIIAGASFHTLLSEEGQKFVSDNTCAVIIGNIVSFIAGLLAVKFLIALISKRGLKDFGWYRLGLAGVLTILLVTGII